MGKKNRSKKNIFNYENLGIKQIKSISKSVELSTNQDQYRSFLVENVQSLIYPHNSNLKAPLKRFVVQYVSNLNKFELEILWKKIFRVVSLIQETNYFKERKYNYSAELMGLLLYPEKHKIKDVLFCLLSEFLLLPPYKNQQQFNRDLLYRLRNLDNFIYRLFDNRPFFLKPIDASNIYDDLESFDWLQAEVIKGFIDHPYINKIFLYVYLPSLGLQEDSKDEISINLTINQSNEGVDIRSIIENYLQVLCGDEGDNINNSNYLIASYPEMDIYVKLTNDSLLNKITDSYFNLSFYTVPKRIEIEELTDYGYLSASLKYLEYEVEKFSKVFSKKFIKNFLLAQLESILESAKEDGINIENELNLFLSNHLNGKEQSILLQYIKLNKSTEEILNFFSEILERKIKKESKVPQIIDLNLYFEEELENVKISSTSIQPSSVLNLKILKQVSPSDIADKLFLEKHLFEKVKMLENYLRNQEKFQQKLLRAPKGAILYGPPGTGKTETVKYLAKTTGRKILYVDISDILSMRLGESEKKIKQMFQEYYSILEKEPAILFIDEADGFFGKRGSFDNQDGVRSIALQELEGFATNKNLKNGFIFLGTNFLENIDKALKERFSFYLKYDLPLETKRKEYIEHMCQKIEKEKGIKVNINIEKLVNLTKGFSYRALFNLFNNILMQVVFAGKKEINNEDIIKNINVTTVKKKFKKRNMGFL